MSRPLTLRLTELAFAMAGAKDRLRVVVAEELGRAAGCALRDLLAADAGCAPVSRSPYSGRDHRSDERRWDARDPWDDDRTDYRDPYDDDQPEDEPQDVKHGGVPPVVAVGLGLWRWWLGRSGSWRAAITVGLAAGLAAVLGGPTVRAILATLAAAAELLSPTPLLLDAGFETR